ncbi:MAG: hypothetical protein PHE67_10795 [Campylobacterales bacterium]|nr:hypothetical protein [Campylobacterales bacterium]
MRPGFLALPGIKFKAKVISLYISRYNEILANKKYNVNRWMIKK